MSDPKAYIDEVERALGRKLNDREQRQLARLHLRNFSIADAVRAIKASNNI